jgi:hypothetical protein
MSKKSILGNHDYAYIFGKAGISGFRAEMWLEYKQIFMDNYEFFDIAWGYQGKNKYTLLTHAGLTETFYNYMVEEIEDPESILNDILVKEADTPWQNLPLAELINYFKDLPLMWTIGYLRKGNSLTGSVIWADKSELEYKRFKGIDQIVGHTNSYFFEEITKENDKLTFVDVRIENNVIGFMTDIS